MQNEIVPNPIATSWGWSEWMEPEWSSENTGDGTTTFEFRLLIRSVCSRGEKCLFNPLVPLPQHYSISIPWFEHLFHYLCFYPLISDRLHLHESDHNTHNNIILLWSNQCVVHSIKNHEWMLHRRVVLKFIHEFVQLICDDLILEKLNLEQPWNCLFFIFRFTSLLIW